MILVSLDHETLHLVLCLWICSSVSWFIVYGNLNRICILLLCENCIHLKYVELVHSAFQVYCVLLLLCLFILLIFESLILKCQLKILNLSTKKIVIYIGTIISLVAQCLPTMWDAWVWSLGWEDSLEKEMATHSSTLA